jgi:PST family polysaccharide transporter
MAASLTVVLVLFRDLGLGAVAVQAPTLTEEQKTTLAWTHLGMGVALGLVTVALAPLVATFYREPRVQSLLSVMSLSLPLIGLNAWPRVLLARDLRFAELNRLETLASVAGTGAMIVAGLAGAGAYAFVVFLLVSEILTLVEAWRVCRWRPRTAARWASLRPLFRAGADLTGYNVLLHLLQQIDALLMGRWFGANALGLYNRPAQLLALPGTHIAAPLTQVLLAALSRLGTASPDFARHVRHTSTLVAHLTLPAAAVCAAIPHEIVRLVFGPTWMPAAPLLRWLAISAAFSSLTTTTYALCVATGHTRRLAAISAIALVLTTAALWLGRPLGPEGLALSTAGANIVLLLPRVIWSTKGTPVHLRDFFTALVGPLALSLTIAGGMILGRILVGDTHWLIGLLVAIASGVTTAALLIAFWPHLRRELVYVWHHRPGAPVLASPPAASNITVDPAR